MPDDCVISVENVSKAYRIWKDPGARLKAPLADGLAHLFPSGTPGRARLRSKAAGYFRDFFALNEVSFSVARGEGVGLVGRNGSGKSTLLQIIAGTLQPTAGTVQVRGRVAALLELGSGFNPDFTGRENVYLNAAVLGFTRRQTDAKFDSIAAFADIGDFLDQPVKTYSSGMMMRLAFAVQTAVEPDILIVDEALSVGDAPFQAKCYARIRALLDTGCAALLVSHDIATVRAFCRQAVWLHSGRVAAQGPSLQVCNAYQNDCLRAMGMAIETAPTGAPASAAPATEAPARPAPAASPAVHPASLLHEDRSTYEKNTREHRTGGRRVALLNFFFLDSAGGRSSVLRWDEEVTAVYVLGSTAGYQGEFQVALNLRTMQGVELLSCSDRTHSLTLDLAPGAETVVRLRTRLPLRAGQYIAFAGVYLFPEGGHFDNGTFDFSRAVAADLVGHAAYLDIAPQFNLGIYGPVQQESALSAD